jgi:hypothetical protein
MSALPIILPEGVIAVYGAGLATASVSGLVSTEGLLFGVVDKVWDGGEIFVYGGDSVMFSEKSIIGRLSYTSGTYTLVPARLVTKEEPAP